MPLFSTNFIGVLNDNFLKNLICFVSIMWLAKEDNHSMVIMFASALLVIPFILFSPLAGKMAKEKSKVAIIRWSKFLEMPIMVLAVFGFIFENIYIVMIAMFLMGLQTSLFSPAKYSIIRDIGGKQGISFGTGTMEMLTFLGVLLGTFLAGVVSDIGNEISNGGYQQIYLCGSLMLFAIIGWLFSLRIKANEPKPESKTESSLNPVVFLSKSVKSAKKIEGLNYTVLALSFFWLIGSMIQMNLIVYCPQKLGLSNTQTSIIMGIVAIGIGLGCMTAGLISNKKVNTRLVPLGGAGIFNCTLLIYLLQPNVTLFTTLIVLTAFFAGFFKVPLNAFMQDRVDGRKLGEMIGYSNLMVFTFILISAGLFGLIETLFNVDTVFLAIVGLTAVITTLVWFKIPGANKLRIKQQSKDY